MGVYYPTKAEIKKKNGVPRLFINGKVTAPILFFGNTDIGTNVTEQVILAGNNGIHLHSVIYNLDFEDDDTDKNSAAYQDLRNCLDSVIQGDPLAQIFLRVKVGAYFKEVPERWKSQLIRYVDNTNLPEGSDLYLVSTASDQWAKEVERKLACIVRYMRTSIAYMEHIACIHLENCEWFEYGFRECGSDVSAVNDAKFIEWQRIKYGENYDCAVVPRDLPNNISTEFYKNTLLLEAEEQRFIDYFDYINQLVATRIEQFAKVIKEGSQRELVVIAFYGYLFELADCQSGHFALQKLLKSPYLDGFAGPVSYGDRAGVDSQGAVGATSAYMTVVDSMTRNGKIWFQESDQRTFVNHSPSGGWLPNLQSLEDIYEVHKREIGDAMLHSAGLWAMDLCATGWLLENSIWENIGKLKTMYQDYLEKQIGCNTFSTLFIVDEKAESIVGQPSFNGISGNLLASIRYEAYHAGISFGFAEIQDVIDGKFADATLYVFLNPYRILHENAVKLEQQLHKDGKCAVFVYGFGATSPDDVKLLTGMEIDLTKQAGSTAISPVMRGNVVTHRYAVKKGYTDILGRYENDEIAFARKKAENYTTVFYGGTFLSREIVQNLVEMAKLPIYSYDNDVLVTDNATIIYCASTAGTKTLTLPPLSFSMKTGETRYFSI